MQNSLYFCLYLNLFTITFFRQLINRYFKFDRECILHFEVHSMKAMASDATGYICIPVDQEPTAVLRSSVSVLKSLFYSSLIIPSRIVTD